MKTKGAPTPRRNPLSSSLFEAGPDDAALSTETGPEPVVMNKQPVTSQGEAAPTALPVPPAAWPASQVPPAERNVIAGPGVVDEAADMGRGQSRRPVTPIA